MPNILKNVAFNAGLSAGGALLSDMVMKRRSTSGTRAENPNVSPIVFAIVGAVAAPAVYHLAKPVVRTLAQDGDIKATLQVVPKSMGAAALFGASSLIGATVGGAITADAKPPADYDFGFDVLPGMFVGSFAGPSILAFARAACGPSKGTAIFAALAVSAGFAVSATKRRN